MTWHQTIKASIQADGRSRYAIAKGASVTQANLARYVATGKGLSASSLERLCGVLGMAWAPMGKASIPMHDLPTTGPECTQPDAHRAPVAYASRPIPEQFRAKPKPEFHPAARRELTVAERRKLGRG